jgi:pilus assembly protein CpaE
VEDALGDRRFVRSTVNVQTGGLDAAVGFHANNPTPDILLVEATQQNSALLDGVDRLAEVCDPTTRVVIIGDSNDVALYRTLIRRGVSDYLAAPLESGELAQTIADLDDRGASERARVISFIGAKGGVGSSTVAQNVAWSLARMFGEDVAILDLDIPFGTVGHAFNIVAPQGIDGAISDGERLDDVLLERYMPKFEEHLALLTSPVSLDADGDIDPAAFEVILDMVRARTSFVVLDLPHRWAPWTRQILYDSDQVVITANPDLASLQHTKNLVDILRAERGEDGSIHMVLNHTGMARKIELGTKDFRDATGNEPTVTLPHDAMAFGAATNNGQMLGQSSKKHKAVAAFNQLATRVSGRQPAKKRGHTFSWKRGSKK